MKIKITKEKDKQYFAEIIGQLGIHAVGESPEQSMEYLVELYKDINESKSQKLQKSMFVNKLKNPMFNFAFKSLTVCL